MPRPFRKVIAIAYHGGMSVRPFSQDRFVALDNDDVKCEWQKNSSISTLWVSPNFTKLHYSKGPHLYLKQQISARLKGCVCMPPWHAIPFLKALGMLTPNPCQNG